MSPALIVAALTVLCAFQAVSVGAADSVGVIVTGKVVCACTGRFERQSLSALNVSP